MGQFDTNTLCFGFVKNIPFTFDIDFIRSGKGKWCEENEKNVLKEFIPPSTSDNEDTIYYAKMMRNQCEEYCTTVDSCWGCGSHCPMKSPCQWNAIPRCGNVKCCWEGLIDGEITQKKGNDSQNQYYHWIRLLKEN